MVQAEGEQSVLCGYEAAIIISQNKHNLPLLCIAESKFFKGTKKGVKLKEHAIDVGQHKEERQPLGKGEDGCLYIIQSVPSSADCQAASCEFMGIECSDTQFYPRLVCKTLVNQKCNQATYSKLPQKICSFRSRGRLLTQQNE